MSGSNKRVISKIRWASLCDRPDCIPLARPKGAKAAGLRYERLFAKQFPEALHGQWFEYEDANGHGYCQPDVILSLLPRCLVVFESKYTLTAEAFAQLEGLYLPVVRAAFKAPAVGVVVTRNLVPVGERVKGVWERIKGVGEGVSTLEEAIRQAQSGFGIPVLHWVGQNFRSNPLHNKPSLPFQIKYPTNL